MDKNSVDAKLLESMSAQGELISIAWREMRRLDAEGHFAGYPQRFNGKPTVNYQRDGIPMVIIVESDGSITDKVRDTYAPRPSF